MDIDANNVKAARARLLALLRKAAWRSHEAAEACADARLALALLANARAVAQAADGKLEGAVLRLDDLNARTLRQVAEARELMEMCRAECGQIAADHPAPPPAAEAA